MCILDEADQVKHPNHITGWESTAARFMLPYAKTVFAYNPPITRSHWAHKFFGEKVKNGAARIYCTWEDIRELLKPKAIEIIEKFKRDDPEYYEYWYLGKPVNFKGMVYPQFNRDTHIINVFKYLSDNPRDRVIELILGLDEGTVNDSTCVTALAVMQSGISVVLDCLEIDPLKIGQQSPAQASRMLMDYLDNILKVFPFVAYIRRRWIFECAEGGQMLRLQFVEDSGEETYLVGNKSIMGDVKRVRSMLSEKLLFFHVAPNVNTMQLIEDIENYIFDEKTGGIKKQQRDDTIDSLEYATKLYYDAPISA
jgi:phage terminase large subunit